MRLQRRELLLASATTALLSGCGIDTSDRPGVLKLAIPNEPSTLDPTLTAATIEARIVDELFEALVIYNGRLEIVPGAAERWDVSDDGLRYVFHLRPLLRYANGAPVPAADFVYALRRQVTPATAATGTEALRWIRNAPELLRRRIKDTTQLGVTAPDDRTVVVELSRADTTLIHAATRFFPLRRADIEAAPRRWTRPDRLVGNGPFRMTTWIPNGHIELVRNSHFHAADTVALNGVSLTVLPDRGTSLKMFQTRELHVSRVPDERLPFASQLYPTQLKREVLNGTLFLGLRLKDSPFENNWPLRRALALALDQQTLVDKVQRTGGVPAFSFISPAVSGYAPAFEDFRDWSMERRLAEARRLYREAGYGPQRPLTLPILYATDARLATMLQAIADMWKHGLGIDTVLDNVEPRVFVEQVARKRFTIMATGWATSRTDAFLLNYLANAGDNEVDYANPRYDELVARASSAPTPAGRATLFAEAERILVDELPLIPLLHGSTWTLVSSRLQGWEANLADIHPARFLSLR